MPQYVSLAQQGFWQPYEQIREGLQAYSARKDRKKERQQDVDWRTLRRGDELTQQGKENARADAASTLNLDTGNFALKEAKKKAGQETALQNFDINNLSSPEQPVPPGFQGPPKPAIKLDLNLPFSAQPPGVQDNLVKYAHDNFLPLQALTQAFQGQQSALTGKTQMPPAPAGMVPKEYDAGGFKFGPAPTTAPPKVVTQEVPGAGTTYWVQDPTDNQWKQIQRPKDDNKDLQTSEIKRLESIDQAARDLANIEKEFANFKHTGPVSGFAQNYLMPWGQDRPVLEQQIHAAVPNLARGVFGEVGVLTDADMKRYSSQFPTLYDTPEVRARKFESLRSRLAEAKVASMDTLGKAGRDIHGFAPQTLNAQVTAPGQTPTFDSIEAANAANIPAGTRILIKNPATGKYKPAVK